MMESCNTEDLRKRIRPENFISFDPQPCSSGCKVVVKLIFPTFCAKYHTILGKFRRKCAGFVRSTRTPIRGMVGYYLDERTISSEGKQCIEVNLGTLSFSSCGSQ